MRLDAGGFWESSFSGNGLSLFLLGPYNGDVKPEEAAACVATTPASGRSQPRKDGHKDHREREPGSWTPLCRTLRAPVSPFSRPQIDP